MDENVMETASLIPKAWLDFVPELKAGKHLSLVQKVAQLRTEGKIIYPPQEQLFQALHSLTPQEVRVIILGQDPYHGQGQAHGLAFSVPHTQQTPPSLRNIFKEIAQDKKLSVQNTQTSKAPSPHLLRWAKQGVLLLNTILSVEHGKALSHAKLGWQNITHAILHTLANGTHVCHTQDLLQDTQQQLVFQGRPLAVLLWGNAARTLAPLFQQRHKHLVLEAAHPSPLSASRGFLGCSHFSTVNAWLKTRGENPIVW